MIYVKYKFLHMQAKLSCQAQILLCEILCYFKILLHLLKNFLFWVMALFDLGFFCLYSCLELLVSEYCLLCI